MIVLAVDPGPVQSAYVLYQTKSRERAARVIEHGKIGNFDLLRRTAANDNSGEHLAIEMIASYGMPVGAEIFDTCVWIGRYLESYRRDYTLVYRREVKLHLCGTMQAKDPNIRQSLIDRFGGKAAIGTKAQPGPLYGITKDTWQALGVAVTYGDRV